MWIGPDGEMPDAQTIGRPAARSPTRAATSSARRSLQTAARDSVASAGGVFGVELTVLTLQNLREASATVRRSWSSR